MEGGEEGRDFGRGEGVEVGGGAVVKGVDW